MTTRTLDAIEAAKLLLIHPQTLMSRARAGLIPGCRVGRAWVFAVPLNEVAISVLLAQVGKNSQFVFTFRGKPVTNVSTKAWWAALDRAGI